MTFLRKTFFFHFGWIPYEERQQALLEADLGISTHFDGLETRFSSRTRLLDYLWAKLPIIATKGDSFADLIEKEEIGVTVPPNDPIQLASAIESLIDAPEKMDMMQKKIDILRPQFFWEEVAKPLEKMIEETKCSLGPNPKILMQTLWNSWQLYGPHAIYQAFRSRYL